MATLDLVHGGFAIPVLQYLHLSGADAERVLEKSKLPMALADDPSIVVPHFLMSRFVEQCAKETADPLFGFKALSYSADVNEEMLPFRRRYFGESKLDQLKSFVSTSNAVTSSDLTLLEDEGAFWVNLIWAKSEGRPSWMLEAFAVALLLNGLQVLLGPDWSPAALRFYARPHRHFDLLKQLDCPIHWEVGCISIAIAKSSLIHTTNNGAQQNPPVHEKPVSVDLSCSNSTSARFALQNILEEGFVTLPEMAERFGLGQRTFKRSLARLGISFSEVLDAYRLERAVEFLRTDISITDLAFELGYEHPQNFARAFKKRVGISPNLYRRNVK